MAGAHAIEPMIGAKEAAGALGCHWRTLKRYAEDGIVPATRIGNRWMFLASLLDDWRKQRLMSNCSKNSQER